MDYVIGILPRSRDELALWIFVSTILYTGYAILVARIRRKHYDLINIALSGSALPTFILLMFTIIDPGLTIVIPDLSIYLFAIGFVGIITFLKMPFK